MAHVGPAQYPYLLFDLDGTLTESGPGIAESLQWAFSQMGLAQESPENIMQYIGPPLRESLRRFRGMEKGDIDRFIEIYRERYETKGMLQSDPYPGIPTLLRRLRDAGYTLLTATSKLEQVAANVLKRYDLADCFAHIGGGDFVLGQDKPSVISRSLAACGASPDRALMIGDRKYDILGAKANAIACVGVLYGYGSRQELIEAGADYLVDSVDALGQLLL